MNLTITITISDDPNVSIQTHAVKVTEEQIRPALARAMSALQAEIDALEECPYHKTPATDV